MSSQSELPPIDRANLERAIAIYLQHAYPDKEVPESVQRRLQPLRGEEPAIVLTTAPFEEVLATDEETSTIYALRIGNRRYPHMKLQVQAWPNEEGFLLSVNTHDQVLNLKPGTPDYEAFRALQSDNQRIKESIESAWDEGGLPTFLKYLRGYLAAHMENPTEESGGVI